MKLLLFSDLHCNERAAASLVARSQEADVLVGAGDFGNMRRGLAVTLDILQTADKPAIFVPGNAESAEELTAACQQWSAAHVLHGTGITLDGVRFFGLGGGVPVTPFGAWSYDLTEEEAAAMLANCTACDVLVCHSPPRNVVDLSSGGRHLGSTAIRAAIERVRPQLMVCGHIHDSAGQQAMLGTTTVINAGHAEIIYEVALPNS